MKECRRCGSVKPYLEFPKQAATPDGYCRWCKACKAAYAVERKSADRELKAKRGARYYRKNRETFLAKGKAWREKNAEAIRESRRLAYQANKDVVNQRNKEWANSSPMRRFSANVRSMTCNILSRRGIIKTQRAVEILGCSYAELARHLEEKFKPGMTWENRGEWHIDHIVPLASAKTEEDLLRLCHYTNLQPLWAFENLSKGARMPDIHMMGSGNVCTDI